MLLEVKGLDVRYGRNHAVKELNLNVDHNEIVAVLGANGAGKSSLLKALHGLVPTQGGSIFFDGNNLTKSSSAERVYRKLALVPEGRQILVSMSVHENLLLGGYRRQDKALSDDIELIYERFPNLGSRRGAQASVLSGGEQQMLAIGRALMTNPKMIILDEATEGLAPLIRNEIWRCLEGLRAQGQSIMVIDKNVDALTRVGDHHYIIERGRVVWEGDSENLNSNEEIKHRYLGV